MLAITRSRHSQASTSLLRVISREQKTRERRVYTPWATGSMVIRRNIGNNTRKYIPLALQATSVHKLGNETERVRASLPL